MPSPILARADALMQRRRQNIGEIDDVPILTDSIDASEDARLGEPALDDDDIPVLLDEEPALGASELATGIETSLPIEPFIGDLPAIQPASATPIIEPTTVPAVAVAASPSLESGIRDIIAHELASRVEQRLMAELPRLIESAVQDFLADQKMIAALQPKDR